MYQKYEVMKMSYPGTLKLVSQPLDLRNIQSFNINIHVLYVQLHSLVIPRLILKSG